MLVGDELIISTCEGMGQPISSADTLQMTNDLILRKKAEEDEAEQIKKVLLQNPLPAGSFVVIDSEGVKEFNG
jgi:hypothetical protein